MVTIADLSDERDAYANVADELNDVDATLTLADLDERAVELARRYAERTGYPFPPSIGDYDRWWDAEHNKREPLRCRCGAADDGSPVCVRCGIDRSDLR